MKQEKKKLEKIREKIETFFKNEDDIRENCIRFCREITRLSSSAIKNIHQGKFKIAEKMLNEGLKILNLTKNNLKNFPEIYFAGFLHSAEKELIEGIVTFNLIYKKEIPNPEKYKFDYVSYLHGVAESTGEIRRYLLDNLRRNKTVENEFYLEIMDEIYFFLLSFNYPDAITRSLRKQVDYVRSILEKTRSEITLTHFNIIQKG